MSAKVSIISIVPAQNTYPAKDGFQFQIRFKTTQPIPDGMLRTHSGTGWRFLYVGATQDSTFEQCLDQFDVPVDSQGIHEFNALIGSPNYAQFPSLEEVFDVGAVLIIACYQGREFFRCSFLVTHRYANPHEMEGKPFTEDGLIRAIYTDEPPRVIIQEKFCWDDPASVLNLIQNDQIINQIREVSKQSKQFLTQTCKL